MTINKYGVIQQTINKSATDRYIEEIYVNGYTIIEDCISHDLLKKVSDSYDKTQQEEERKAKASGSELTADRNIIRCPLAHDEIFLEVARLQTPLSIIEKILGKNIVLLMQNAILNKPDQEQYQAQWHRDLNYQHFVSSKPVAMNFLVCVDDFTVENGATMALPGTHMFESFPSDEYVEKNQVSLTAPKGSVFILNCMTYHRTGDAVKNAPRRRGINHVIGLPFLAQQIDIPRYLKSKRNADYSDDKELFDYLGYRWNPSESAEEWRNLRK